VREGEGEADPEKKADKKGVLVWFFLGVEIITSSFFSLVCG
jgi:hypothetical protein